MLATALIRIAFAHILVASLQGSAMIALVVVAHALLGRRISPRWRGAMWMLVFIRLALPVVPASPISLFNLRPSSIAAPSTVATVDADFVTFGVIPNAAAPANITLSRRAPSIWSPDWLALVGAIWAVVGIALIAHQCITIILFARRLGSLKRSSDSQLLAPMCECADEMGAFPLEIVSTHRVSTPVLAGIMRPVLLMPAGLSSALSIDELRAVMAHELAHAQRRDVGIRFIVTLLVCVHWFNPLVWLAAARYRLESEMDCDERALTLMSNRMEYGSTILKLLEAFPLNRASAGAIGFIGARRAIKRRIAAIAAGPARRWPVAGPLLFLALGCATLTGPRNRATNPPSSVTPRAEHVQSRGAITYVYDVRDLMVNIPNFDDAPNLGIVDSARKSSPAQRSTRARAGRLRDLINLIQREVDPLSWRGNTGTTGSIRESNGQLVITQTPANHEKILSVLQQQRGERAMQVTVLARFISSTAVERQLRASGQRWNHADDSDAEIWSHFLDEKEVGRLLRIAQDQREFTLLTAPHITLFNGQRAYVLVSRAVPYVAGLVSIEGGKAFDPEIGTVRTGVLLDCRATVSSNTKFVTLKLRPQMATLMDLVPDPSPGRPASAPSASARSASAPSTSGTAFIQIPHVKTTRLNATVTIPDGRSAMFRLHPHIAPATQPAPPLETVLLLVRPTIIAQREVELPRQVRPAR
jgi:beta-lactamase regulating signal transducer with metallopeptidase domain